MATDGAHDHPLISAEIVSAVGVEHDRAMAAEKALSDRIAALETAPPVVTPAPGVSLPASIDATGATDVSAALMTFLNGVPANTTVLMPGIYKVSQAIKLSSRKGLILEGLGTGSIRAAGTGYNENYSLLYFTSGSGGSSGCKVHALDLRGNSPTPNVFISGKEGQHGVLTDGGSDFEIYACTGSGFYGDFVEVNSGATNVRIHDNTASTGRNGISVIYGNGVEAWANSFPKCGYCVFDVEPNTSAQPCFNVNLHDNTAATWGNAFFALDGSQTGAAFHDITVSKNTVTAKSLLTVVTGPGRKQRVAFTGNKGTGTATVSFAHVDGLTVTGNTGVTVGVTDCTAAVTSPNP